MTLTTRSIATLSTLFCGAHFGLFLAWVCTTMWGLDAADPGAAIAAMQAMNASVRNGVFAPVFFGTPILLLITAALVWRPAGPVAAGIFAVAGVLVLIGSVLLTMMVNVPMNEELALITVPADTQSAQAFWQAYSPEWQFWNQMRTLASGAASVLALAALQMLPHR